MCVCAQMHLCKHVCVFVHAYVRARMYTDFQVRCPITLMPARKEIYGMSAESSENVSTVVIAEIY